MAYTFDPEKGYVDEAGNPYMPGRGMPTPDRNFVGEIATGVKRGFTVALPEMVGKAMQAPGKPGGGMYDFGAQMEANAKARGELPENQLNPDDHNFVVNALASGAEMLAPSLTGLAVSVPVAMAGAPVAAAVAGGAAAAGLFGMSQFEETNKKVKEAGGTDDDAFKAGMLSGTIEGSVEGAMSFFPLKLLKGLGRAVGGKTLDDALKSMAKPQIMKQFAGTMAKTAAAEVGTEMFQNASETAVENAYGVDYASPWAAAKQAIAPTLGLTALLAPLGLHGHYKQAGMIKKDVANLVAPMPQVGEGVTAEDVQRDYDARALSVNRLGTVLQDNPPPGMTETEWNRQTNEWRLAALESLNAGQAPEINTILSGAFSAQMDKLRQETFDRADSGQSRFAAPQAAQTVDEWGEPIAPAKIEPVLKGSMVNFGGKPVTVLGIGKDGEYTLELTPGHTVTLGAEESAQIGAAGAIKTPTNEPVAKSEHVSGLVVGDKATVPTENGPADGVVSAVGNSIRVTVNDRVYNFNKSAWGKITSKDSVVQGRIDAAAAAAAPKVKEDTDATAGTPADKKATPAKAAKKVEAPAAPAAAEPAQPAAAPAAVTTPENGDGKGQETPEVLNPLDAVAAQAKTDKVHPSSISAAVRKITGATTGLPLDQQVAKVREIAAIMEADGESKAQVEILRKYADHIEGAQNGTSTAVDKGTERKSTEGETGAKVLPSSAGGDQRNDPAESKPDGTDESLTGNIDPEAKPVRQKVAKSKQQAAKEEAARKREANLAVRAEGAKKLELLEAQQRALKEAEDLKKADDATRAMSQDEKNKAFSKLKDEDKADVAEAWDAQRAAEAKKVGKIDLKSFAVPAWAELPGDVQATWAVGPQQVSDYHIAAQQAHQTAAVEKAKEVNSQVDAVNRELANANAYANQLHEIAKTVIWLGNHKPHVGDAKNLRGKEALDRVEQQREYNEAVEAVKLAYVKARRMMTPESRNVLKDSKKIGATAEQMEAQTLAEYRQQADKLTLADIRLGLFKDIESIMPARSIEEYRQMSASRVLDEITPLQQQIIDAYAGTPEGKTTKEKARIAEIAKEREMMRGQLLKSLQEAGSILWGMDAKKWTIQDVKDTFELMGSAMRATTTPRIQAALQAITGTKGLAQLLDMVSLVSSNRYLKLLAPMLKAMGVDGITVVYSDELIKSRTKNKDGEYDAVRGRFNSSTNTLTIYRGGENAHVVLHEAVHGLTVNALRRAEAIVGKPRTVEEIRLIKALNNLKALYGFLEGREDMKGEYAFKNLAEFLAEALTSVTLQHKLRSIEIPAGLLENQKSWFKSLFDGYVETIKNFLGIAGVSHNALAAAIDVTGPFLGPNTTVTAPRLMAESQAASAKRKEVVHDMISASPASALAAPGLVVGEYVDAVDRWASKVDLSNANASVRKAAWHVSSTKHIERMVEKSPALKTLHQPIGSWFKADEAKTNVIMKVTSFMQKHLSNAEAAMHRTNEFAKANRDAAFLANEQSMIADEVGKAIDPSKDFAGNKAAIPLLDEKLKDRINRLNREYTRISHTTPEIIKVVANGFKENRKAYTQHIASLVSSALQHYKMSTSSASPMAEAVLTKFGKVLDIRNTATPHVLVDGMKFSDARAEELDTELRKAFDMIDKQFGGDDAQKAFGIMRSAFLRSVDKPYQFLNRPGQYFAGFDVTDTSTASIDKINDVLKPFGVQVGGFPGSSKHVFIHLESPKQMDEAIAAINGLGTLVDKKSVNGGAKSDIGRLENAFGASQTISKFREIMVGKYDELRAQGAHNPQTKLAYDRIVSMANASLVDMLESDSARTTMTRRKGTPGESSDYRQAFAKRSEYYISLISNIYAKPKFDEAFRQMNEAVGAMNKASPQTAIRGQEVVDELIIRHGNALHPVESPIIDTLKAFGYHFYLSASPAFIAVNALQPYHLTWPELGGKYGFVKSFMSMMQATHLAYKVISTTIAKGWGEGKFMGVVNAELELSKAGLSASQVEFIQHMVDSGTVDFTQTHELGRMADGRSRTLANAAKTIGTFTHYSEMLNRLTAGLAAFDLAKDMPTEARTRYSIDVVNKTQFLYSDHNTGRILGRHGFAGKVTPLAASFQNYAFQMMEQYIRLADQGFIRKLGTVAEQEAARKTMYGTLATTSILAGTMGLPFASVIAAAFNAANGDDDKEDIRNAYRRWLNDAFGKDIGEVIARGAPRALGIDMSNRAGHADLLPGSRFLADRREFKDKIKDGSLQMMGPALNAAFDVIGGMEHISDGDVAKGFETMLPAALKGYYKASQLASNGHFNNAKGNELPMPVNNWDILVQSLGFTPAKKAEQSEANFYYQSATNLTKQAKAQMVNEAVKAYEGGQMEDFGVAMQAITEYNYRNPTNPITDVAEKLVGRARGRAFAAMSGTGIIDSNVKHLPRISEFAGWANTGIR